MGGNPLVYIEHCTNNLINIMIGAQRIGNALRRTVPGKNLYYMQAFSHTTPVTKSGPPRPTRISEYRRDYIKRLFELAGFVYSTVSKTVVADEVKEFVAHLTQGNGGISGFAPSITEDSYDAWASDSTIAMRKLSDHYDGNPFEIPEWLPQMINREVAIYKDDVD